MNNRYICKGKRKDNDEWIEGDLAQWNDGDMSICLGTGVLFKVVPETVGQCTGLKDKNGKLIFEGDVVESRASENQDDWKKWVVGFSDGSFCFNRKISKKRKHKYEENLLCVDAIELYGLTVIGNIHDKPELLEVKE